VITWATFVLALALEWPERTGPLSGPYCECGGMEMTWRRSPVFRLYSACNSLVRLEELQSPHGVPAEPLTGIEGTDSAAIQMTSHMLALPYKYGKIELDSKAGLLPDWGA
jgi:hypothetical protein